MIQLDADRTTLVPDRQLRVQPAELHPQVVQEPECLPGEVAEFRVMALGLELGDDDDRQHHLVLGESADRCRVRQQNAGVEDIRTPSGSCKHCSHCWHCTRWRRGR